MNLDDEAPNAQEYRARGLGAYGKPRDYAAGRLALDAKAVAETPEGKRLLRWLVSGPRDATRGCFGDWRDHYNHGRREAAEQLEAALRRLLPREAFLEIIYPKMEE